VSDLVHEDFWGFNRQDHLYFNLADAYTALAGNIVAPVHGLQSAPMADTQIAPVTTQTNNRTVAAIQDIKTWLNLTTEEVARLLGTSKGAVYYWRRADAEPRAQVGRNITRIHSLLRALRRVTTPEGFSAVLRAKPQGHDRSTFDLLMSHDLERAEALLNEFIFTRARPAEPYWARRVSDWPGSPSSNSTREIPQLKPPRANGLRVKLRTGD
jgi:DNA-binding transcriptional regulator YiaG